MIGIALLGRLGKMGQAIQEIVRKSDSFSISQNLSHADVLIDFTSPSATLEHIQISLNFSKPLIIGTTGLSYDIEKAMQQASEKIPLFYSPNFSLGIAACMHAADALLKCLRDNARVEIEETHHTQKKDAPSGTALKFAKLLEKSQEDPIAIRSHRLPDVVGEHKIFFALEEERIELSHFCNSRNVFAKGVLLAAQFLYNKPAGSYGMKNLFENAF